MLAMKILTSSNKLSFGLYMEYISSSAQQDLREIAQLGSIYSKPNIRDISLNCSNGKLLIGRIQFTDYKDYAS